jgi:hypothetical protein
LQVSDAELDSMNALMENPAEPADSISQSPN